MRELQAVAAGGLDGLAVDPGSIVGSEKRCDRRDVAGLADAAKRGAGNYFLVEVAADEAGGVDAFGFDHPGIERVDANLLAAKFLGKRLRHGIYSALGGAVDRGCAYAVRSDRADVDDA